MPAEHRSTRATVDPELLRNVARSRPRVAITAATPEVVDLVAELGALARLILTHNARVMSGEPVDWAVLGELLAAAQHECQRQAGDDVEGSSEAW